MTAPIHPTRDIRVGPPGTSVNTHAHDAPDLLPVHVLTGPLGSGKSTLLNRVLRGGLAPDTAVVVNEFGQAGLDRTFIQEEAEEVLVMDNGCICCTLRTDLVATLMRLAAMRDAHGWPLRRVIVETSGITDPVPVLHTLRADARVRTRFRAGSVMCTVDAQAGLAGLAERPEYAAQLAAADVAVLTKADLIDEVSLSALARAVAHANPLAQLLRNDDTALQTRFASDTDSDPNHGFRALDTLAVPRAAPDTPSGHGVRHIVLRQPGPLPWPVFAVWLTRLLHLHGDRILRTKGVLYDPGRDAWIGVHGVRRFLHPPVHLQVDKPPAFGSCLVFITEGLDPAGIAESYRRLQPACEEPAALEP